MSMQGSGASLVPDMPEFCGEQALVGCRQTEPVGHIVAGQEDNADVLFPREKA